MGLVLVPLSLREASEFVTNFHRHNKAPRGGKFAIGVSDESGLVGVAIVGRPLARSFDDYTAEVLRVCTTDGSPKNVCSKLYGACWRAWKAMGGHKLITYTLQTETGASVKAAGWKIVAQTKKRKEGSAWTSKGRERDWQPIYGQLKFRWEKEK